MKKLYLLVQFLPLSIFLAYARSKGLASDAWAIAFQLGALLALIESFILILTKVRLDRLILGANIFLIIGGAGFFLHLQPILAFYLKLQESALLLSVLIVGIISTFSTRAGFIELPTATRIYVLRNSGYLIAVAIVCFAFSIYFRGNALLAGVIPFVCLILARWLLRRYYFTRSCKK